MYTTMKEYFKAKEIDLDTLPFVYKSAQGYHEYIVFKNGVMARLMRGVHRAKKCVWFPDQAKYVNKVMGCQIFDTAAPHRLIVENNNVNNIIYETFGEVSVMWTVPIADKIVNKFYEDLEGRAKTSQFVGYSIILSITNIGNETELEVTGKFPELTSANQTTEEFRKRMEDDYSHIEACIGNEFLRLLSNALGTTFLGYDNTAHYSKNDNGDVIRLNFYRDERVNRIKGKPSFTAGKLIDDCETQRIQS